MSVVVEMDDATKAACILGYGGRVTARFLCKEQERRGRYDFKRKKLTRNVSTTLNKDKDFEEEHFS